MAEEKKMSLRCVEVTDADDFMVWATDDRVSRFCTWETYSHKAQAVEFFNDIAIPHPWFRLICIDDRPVGSISVTPNPDRSRGELGYVLAYEHWGTGIVTRAVKMVASTIFKEWPELQRLEAFVDPDNIGSQRVLEKVGFLREGLLRKYVIMKGNCRDRLVFSLLPADVDS